MKIVSRFVKAILESDNEAGNIEKLLRSVDRGSRVLDVGCGFGEKMRLLGRLGFRNLTGVEKNLATGMVARANGLDVRPVGALDSKAKNEKFDLLVFSHIIEHFSYEDLLRFLESYFAMAQDGARVLIVTPLMSSFFYDDLDHVRPYPPSGIDAVFSRRQAQVQYRSRYQLELNNLYFRRMPFRFVRYSRSDYLGRRDYPAIAVNILAALVFRASFHVVGRTTGWAGVYTIRCADPENSPAV